MHNILNCVRRFQMVGANSKMDSLCRQIFPFSFVQEKDVELALSKESEKCKDVRPAVSLIEILPSNDNSKMDVLQSSSPLCAI